LLAGGNYIIHASPKHDFSGMQIALQNNVSPKRGFRLVAIPYVKHYFLDNAAFQKFWDIVWFDW